MTSRFIILLVLVLPTNLFSQVKPCEFPKLFPFCVTKILRISRPVGKVLDQNSLGIVDACVTLFDKDRKPVAFASTDEKGRFKLERVPDGKYLFVVNTTGFATAVNELTIDRRAAGPKSLFVHMVFSGIDTCSVVNFTQKGVN